VGRLEDPSATRTPRSQPLPGRTGLSLQQGMPPTLPIAALLSSIPGARPREKARDGSREACDRPDPTNITRQSLGSLKSHRAELADDERMTQQIGIDGALLDGQAETRRENIFKLHPEEFGVERFVWHWLRSWKRNLRVEELESSRVQVWQRTAESKKQWKKRKT